jgi:hypothetical protein
MWPVVYLPLGGDRAQCPQAQNLKSGGAVNPEKLPRNSKQFFKRNLGCIGMGLQKMGKI